MIFSPTYLYIKQHTITGKLYFGKSKKPLSKMLSYRGSGSHWKNHIKKHKPQYVITLWYELYDNPFDSVADALSMSKSFDIVNNKSWLNAIPENGLDGGKNIATSDYAKSIISKYNKNKVNIIDSEGNTFKVAIDDPKWVGGEYKSVSCGKVSLKNSNGDCFTSSITDSRYLSGEFVGVAKNTATVIDENNRKFRISIFDKDYINGKYKTRQYGWINAKDSSGTVFKVKVDDPRLLSKEFVGVNKGKTWKFKKAREKVNCPNCLKLVDISTSTRWHFDNCKFKKS